MEPSQLRRGKKFHKLVQESWSGTIAGGKVWAEYGIKVQGVRGGKSVLRHGRVDLFVDQVKDFVSVFEIKATDWDRILPKNRRKNLSSHVRQTLRYIDKFLEQDMDLPGFIGEAFTL